MYYCYTDIFGNCPCDNGVLCDKCSYTDVKIITNDDDEQTMLTMFKKAVKFELFAIKNNSTAPSPYYTDIINMENGSMLWEIVNSTIELYFEDGER